MKFLGQIAVVTKYELLKHLRGMKLLGLVLISLLVTFLVMGLPPLLGTPYPSDITLFVSRFLNFIVIFAVLAGMFFGGDAIVSEYQQKTAYLLFPNPIKRKSIYIGKFAAAVLSSTFALLVFYAIISFFTFSVFGKVPFELIYSIVVAFIVLVAVMSFAFLISTVMKGIASATMLIFFMFFMIMPIVDFAVIAAQGEPVYTLTYNADISKYIMSNPYPTQDSMSMGMSDSSPLASFSTPVPQVWPGIPVMLIYFIVCFVAGMMLFERKELR